MTNELRACLPLSVSVPQAVLLLLGRDPIDDGTADVASLPGYMAVWQAVTSAILSETLPATVVHANWNPADGWLEWATPDRHGLLFRPKTDWERTSVRVAALCEWLVAMVIRARGGA